MARTSLISIGMALMALVLTFNVNARSTRTEPVEYVKAEATISANTVYVGQPFTYKIVIISDNPNVNSIRAVDTSTSSDVTLLTRLKPSGRPVRLDNGLYRIEAKAEIISLSRAGTIDIPGATYMVDFVVPVTAYDPFWGYYQAGERVSKQVKVKGVKVKCKNLPKAPDDYSGAIGDFKFVCDTPAIRVKPGGEVSVLYTITGRGLLQDIEIPPFKDVFTNGVRLKNVRPDESAFLQNDEIISRITYECRVTVAESGEYVVPAATFTYFSPSTGKYVTIGSGECTIKCGDLTRQSPTEGQYVCL